MASIQKIKQKFGVVYKAAVCVKRRRETATFDTQSEAHKWAEETEYLLRNGLPLPGELPAKDMDFAEAVEKYTLAVAKRKKANTRRLDQEIGDRLLSAFKGKSLQTIKAGDIAAYRDQRLLSVGSSSVIQDLSFITCMYRMARVDWSLDVINPCTDIRRPAAPKHRRPLLTLKEIGRLLDYCCVSKQKQLYCYVVLQLHTGMRPSEGAGLRWGQVLIDQGMIDLTETKTDPRRVPMTATVLAMLKDLQEQKTGKGDDWVFLPPDTTDRERPHRYFRRGFESAVKAAGIKNFTLYGLRHSAASYLLMNGVDIRTVADILGHRNISQTMTYTHFLDAYKVAAIQAIDRL